MRILLSILCLAFLASGCETCKPCPQPAAEGSIVTQAKAFVADTATVVGYVIPTCNPAPAPACQKAIVTEQISMIRIRETPTTFTETSVIRKEGTK
jgi:hypothetical protein